MNNGGRWFDAIDVGSDTLTGVNSADYRPPFKLAFKLHKQTAHQGGSATIVGRGGQET
jgi:hypothetical protein